MLFLKNTINKKCLTIIAIGVLLSINQMFSQTSVEKKGLFISINIDSVEGARLYELKKYDSAIVFFTRLITINPPKSIYYGYRGASERKLEKYDLALTDLNRAIKLDNENSWLYFERGIVLKSIEKFELAIKDFDTVISLDAKNHNAFFLRAYCNRKLGKYEEALKDYNVVIRMLPEVYDLYSQRGIVYFEMEDYDKAINDFDVYLSSGMKEALYAILYKRGVSYAMVSKNDSAISDLQRVNEIEQSALVYKYLGLAYQQKRDSVKSRNCFIKSIQMDSTDIETYFYYGYGEYTYDNCKKALELYKKGEALANKNQIYLSVYYRKKGSIEGCLKDTTGALADFQMALKLDSNNYNAYFHRILFIHADLKYLNQTRDDIEKLIEIYPDKKELTFLYSMDAIYSVYMSDTIKAEHFYKKAIEISPEKGYTYYNLAAYYFYFRNRMEHSKLIIELLEKSITLQKNRVDFYKLLAMSYALINNDSEKSCEVAKLAENQFGNIPEIKKMKNGFCKNKRELKEMQTDYLVFPDEETSLKNYFLYPPPNKQLMEKIISLIHE
jgi:tetratricopeptide (TPR) repeat protein